MNAADKMDMDYVAAKFREPARTFVKLSTGHLNINQIDYTEGDGLLRMTVRFASGEGRTFYSASDIAIVTKALDARS